MFSARASANRSLNLRTSQADTTELIGLIIEVHEIIIRRPKGSPETGPLRSSEAKPAIERNEKENFRFRTVNAALERARKPRK
jgi:hypothetical protein